MSSALSWLDGVMVGLGAVWLAVVLVQRRRKRGLSREQRALKFVNEEMRKR